MFSVVLCFAAAHLPAVAGHLTVFPLRPTFCRAFTIPGARGSYTCSTYGTQAVIETQKEAVLEAQTDAVLETQTEAVLETHAEAVLYHCQGLCHTCV